MADLTDIKSAAPQLPVGDLQRSLDFYASRLGFRTVDIWPEGAPTEALVSKNDAHLRLIEEVEPGGDPRGEATVTIQVDNTAGLHGLLSEIIEIEESLGWSQDGRRYFAFRDPDGHRVVFIDMA